MAVNKKKPTPEQEQAINHRNGGAIIDANAGAGKTTVLTTRVIDILSDKEKKVDPAGLVIITFTKKAAAELKTRLNRKMREKLAVEPNNAEFLRSQCASLHKARISTISSFCFSLIKENIEYSDFAQGLSIMEEARAKLMRFAMIEQAIEEFYKTASDSQLQAVMDHFAGKFGDNNLIEAISGIIDYASNLPDPDGWYRLSKDKSRLYHIEKEADDKLNNAFTHLNTAYTNLDSAYNLLVAKEKPKKPEKQAIDCIQAALPFFKKHITDMGNAIASGNFGSIPLMDKGKIKKLIPSFAKSSIGEEHSALVEQAVDLLVEISGAAFIKRRLYISQPLIDILIDIAQNAERLYKAEKATLNTADYSDAERQLYNMLKNHPEIKEKAGIEYFIVDEFQDSNRLQYEIFKALSDNEQNLYFVGDMKQSIYGFRGAQPEVFDEITKNPLYKHIYLNDNFRSRDNVIDSVNDIFCPIMTAELGGVDYEKYSQLKLGNETNISTSPEDTTEVIIVTDEKKNSESGNAEADYVAYHINKLIKTGYQIKDRPCRYEDFAILLRSNSKKAPFFADALVKYGIPSVTKGDGELFSEPEIVLMTDYIKVIDDPYNNQSLARLLMSCIFGFSADDIAAVRTCTAGFDIKGICQSSEECEKELKAYAEFHRKKPLYSCIKKAVSGYEIKGEYYPALALLYKEQPSLFGTMTDEKCISFEKELDRLRGVMAASSPAELIKHIYDTTPTADLLTVGENAENRRINLMGLLSVAEEYDRYNSDGILSGFIAYTEEMNDKGQKAEISEETVKNGVQIMSIHASKGLEFPIVFICDCAKGFNTDDASTTSIKSEKYGLCLKDVNKAKLEKIPSPAYEIVSEQILKKLRSEEMRLLYVAATRAEYKLIFTGSVADDIPEEKSSPDENLAQYKAWVRSHMAGDKKSSYSDDKIMTTLIEKSNFLAWLQVPLFTGKTPRISYKLRSLAKEIEKDMHSTTISETTDQPVIVADPNVIATIKQQIAEEYSYAASTKIAAKYTATGLAAMKRQNKEKECRLYVSKPAFAKNKGKLTGKKRGDAYHKLMEHIPFEKPMSEKEVMDFIADNTADFLSDAERECIKPADISGFFNDDIALRMLSSGRIYREYPIFHRLSDDIMSQISEDYESVTDKPYVQGIVDMFFIEDDGIVLIDYKTDSHSDEQALDEDYSFQLMVYEEALEKAFGKPVKEKYIYSFGLGKMVKV